MNAITTTKLTKASLTMTLGAALVAGCITATNASAADFDEFSAQARARVLTEATSQPGPQARVKELRDTLQGARVIAERPTVASSAEEALAAIRSEQAVEFRADRAEQLAAAMAEARLVKRLPTRGRRIDDIVADIHAEQLKAMQQRASGELGASMANAHVINSVAYAGPTED